MEIDDALEEFVSKYGKAPSLSSESDMRKLMNILSSEDMDEMEEEGDEEDEECPMCGEEECECKKKASHGAGLTIIIKQ